MAGGFRLHITSHNTTTAIIIDSSGGEIIFCRRRLRKVVMLLHFKMLFTPIQSEGDRYSVVVIEAEKKFLSLPAIFLIRRSALNSKTLHSAEKITILLYILMVLLPKIPRIEISQCKTDYRNSGFYIWLKNFLFILSWLSLDWLWRPDKFWHKHSLS